MLSKEVINLLNEQIAKEMFASNLYLSMSSWCFENSYDGAGEFLLQHAAEESEHAKKLIKYLNETDSHVKLASIPSPDDEFKSLLDVFEQTYEHEQSITKSINELVDFMQWYVAEQHEEEALFRGIVDKIKLIKDNANGLYLADQYIKTLVNK